MLHWYPNLFGGDGVANVVVGLAGAQVRQGAEVLIAALPARREPSRIAHALRATGVRVIVWKPAWQLYSGKLGLRGLSRADRAMLADLRPDVVHLHGEFNPDNLRVPSLFGRPAFLSPHGAFHPVVRAKHRIGKSLYIALARSVLYRRVIFHASSPMEESHVRSVCPRGRVVVWPNGPSPWVEELFTRAAALPAGPTAPAAPSTAAAPASPRARSSDQLVFFYAGRLDVFNKGLDILLDAFAAATRGLPGADVVLRMAGPDFAGGRSELLRRARALGVEGRVGLLGYLDDDALAAAYEAADVYLQLSRNEAFSLSAADALFLGKPVILGTGVGNGSYPEIGGLPHVARVAPDPREAALAMIDAVRRIEELRDSAARHRAAIRAFLSWDDIAARSLEAYRDAL